MLSVMGRASGWSQCLLNKPKSVKLQYGEEKEIAQGGTRTLYMV